MGALVCVVEAPSLETQSIVGGREGAGSASVYAVEAPSFKTWLTGGREGWSACRCKEDVAFRGLDDADLTLIELGGDCWQATSM